MIPYSNTVIFHPVNVKTLSKLPTLAQYGTNNTMVLSGTVFVSITEKSGGNIISSFDFLFLLDSVQKD